MKWTFIQSNDNLLASEFGWSGLNIFAKKPAWNVAKGWGGKRLGLEQVRGKLCRRTGMDRRRFVPSTEGLEERKVLSTVGSTAGSILGGNGKTPATVLPQTYEQRLQRVTNLPFFLGTFGKDVVIPKDSIKEVRVALTSLIGNLTPAPSYSLQNFNVVLRKVGSHTSLSKADVKALDNSFGRVLQLSSASPAVEAQLREGMNGLAKADANSVNPTVLATNDYSLVLQTALGMGRPFHAPVFPSLNVGDRFDKKVNISNTATPTFTGTYEANSTMQIVDQAGNVVGSSLTKADGTYTIKLTTALPTGTYKLFIRAIDTGFVSLPSTFETIKVHLPTVKGVSTGAVPKGPLAL